MTKLQLIKRIDKSYSQGGLKMRRTYCFYYNREKFNQDKEFLTDLNVFFESTYKSKSMWISIAPSKFIKYDLDLRLGFDFAGSTL